MDGVMLILYLILLLRQWIVHYHIMPWTVVGDTAYSSINDGRVVEGNCDTTGIETARVFLCFAPRVQVFAFGAFGWWCFSTLLANNYGHN
jgi:hypothetical protein